jgi:hypothetical protein
MMIKSVPHAAGPGGQSPEGTGSGCRIGPAPAVGASVGGRGDKLVDQVAFRSHDFHPVIAGLLGQAGAAGKILDLPEDFVFGKRFGFEDVDRRLQGRGADQLFVKPVPAGMQDLQGDLAAALS